MCCHQIQDLQTTLKDTTDDIALTLYNRTELPFNFEGVPEQQHRKLPQLLPCNHQQAHGAASTDGGPKDVIHRVSLRFQRQRPKDKATVGGQCLTPRKEESQEPLAQL